VTVGVCRFCGVEFKRQARGSRARDAGIYCSRACAFNEKRRRADARIEQLRKAKTRACAVCSAQIVGGLSVTCSRRCRLLRNALIQRKVDAARSQKSITSQSHCQMCGVSFVLVYGVKRRLFCSERCQRRSARRISKASRRARLRNVKREPINPVAVFERASWQCQSCRVSTPRELRGSIDDRAPELDHVIPLAAGGSHTLDNVQLLCRRCNRDKGGKVAA